MSLLKSHVGPWRPGLDPSGVIFILFFVMRAWINASWSQLRPREVSHRSVKCGGVGGLRASIDACQKLLANNRKIVFQTTGQSSHKSTHLAFNSIDSQNVPTVG